MNDNQSSPLCVVGGWGTAVLAAVVALVILMGAAGWSFAAALFGGVVVCIIVGAMLSWFVCQPQDAAQSGTVAPVSTKAPAAAATPTPAPEAPPATEAAEAPKDAATAKPAATSGTTDSSDLVKPSTALAGEAELASRKGTWTYNAGAAAPAAASKPAPAPAPAADPAPSEAGNVDYDGDGTLEGTDEGTRPATLSAPRDGGADNLKEIKGIGPKLEQLCNSLGFYHFDQIAAWTPDEVAWVDANLTGFKGRVSRDDWVAQAKILAAGGETEFSKRVDDGNVY